MPAAGTAALVGAAIGGGVAIVTGGDPLKGALLGAVGGGIGSVVSGAVGGVAGGMAGGSASGAVTQLLNGGNPIEGALTGGVQGGVTGAIGGDGTAGAVDKVGIDAPDSATQSVAKQLVDAPAANVKDYGIDYSESPNAGAPPSAAAPASGAPADGAPPAKDYSAFTGATPTDVPNPVPDQTITAGGDAPNAPPGLIDRVLKAAKENKEVAAALVTAGGMGLAGAAKGVGDVLATERKAALELENKKKLTQFYRDFIQGGSQGGQGTTLAVQASSQARPLQFLTGGSVYSPSGLIGSRV